MISEYDQKNYMQFLRDVKPKWSEAQVYDSAKKHFGKSFTLFVPEFEETDTQLISDYTVKELNALIKDYGFDIDLRLNKAEKIEAINEMLG